MVCRFSDFRWKEVINVCTGTRMGYVCDARFQYPDGRISALIVPGRAKCFGLLGREEDYILPWESISRIGEDLILVECDRGIRREKRPKRPFF